MNTTSASLFSKSDLDSFISDRNLRTQYEDIEDSIQLYVKDLNYYFNKRKLYYIHTDTVHILKFINTKLQSSKHSKEYYKKLEFAMDTYSGRKPEPDLAALIIEYLGLPELTYSYTANKFYFDLTFDRFLHYHQIKEAERIQKEKDQLELEASTALKLENERRRKREASWLYKLLKLFS